MDVMGMVTGGLTHILSGGTLGVLGAVGSGVLDFFKTKEKNKQELAIITAQKELALANKDSAVLLETIKLSAASYDNDKATYGKDVGWLDSYRGSLRPNVCYFLLAASTYLTIWAFMRVGVDNAIIAEAAKFGIYTCMDLTALAVSWYFGARQIDKMHRRK